MVLSGSEDLQSVLEPLYRLILHPVGYVLLNFSHPSAQMTMSQPRLLQSFLQ